MSKFKSASRALELLYQGSRVLRTPANAIGDVRSKKIQSLAEGMASTMRSLDGVGLAAPQVNHSLRAFVMVELPEDESKAPAKLSKLPITFVANPIITSLEGEPELGWEACLSIPGISALVPRHPEVRVEYTDKNGEPVSRKLEGDMARIFQHEHDHLDGLTILDRVTDNRCIVMTDNVEEFEASCDDIFAEEDEDDEEWEEDDDDDDDTDGDEANAEDGRKIVDVDQSKRTPRGGQGSIGR